MTIFTLFLTTGCENDSPTAAPESATISGIITFTGDWPTVDTVAVSLSSNWPPQGAPAASLEITSSDLSNGTYTYTFENITFGSYACIAVSWQDPNDPNPATNQHTLGAYGGVYPFFTAYGGTDPTTVTVSEVVYFKIGLDFSAVMVYDCNGTLNGSAVEDCAGTCGGSAVLSGCDNVCNSIAVEDCAGVCGGSSVLSGCDNVCNSTAVEDCAGTCGGSAVEDCAGTCGGTSVLSGCDNVCNSTAVEDCTGLCGGSTTGCSVTDIDGNGYTSVTIGTQEWLVQNLKTTKYKDGTAIPTGHSDSDWSFLTTGGYAVYDNNSSNADIYGYHYNWAVVNDERGVCPEGFHVPSDTEWTTLITYFDENVDPDGEWGWQSYIAGGMLKDTGTVEGGDGYWYAPNEGATNESGFTGLPGGYRGSDSGTNSGYHRLGSTGYFWSATENAQAGWGAWYLRLDYSITAVHVSSHYKDLGFSIRCVGD